MSTQMKAQIDQLLTQAMGAYTPVGFIAEKIFPKVKVNQYSGKLGKLTNSHLRIQNTIMGGKGAARRVDILVRETDGYDIESHGLEGVVTDRDYKNFSQPFDAEKEETMALTLAMLIGKEKSIADTLSNTAIVTQNATLAGQAQFNDYANSDPLAKFKTAQQTVEDACGMAPNTAIMNSKVRRALRYHPAIIEHVRGKIQPGARLTDEELADALDVDRVLVGGPKYNSAAPGQADALSNIWGNNLIFGVLPAAPEVGQVSLGYEVGMNGKTPREVRKWDLNNPADAKAILCTDHYDYLLSNLLAAFLYKDAVA